MSVTRMQIFQLRQKKKINKTILTELQSVKLNSTFYSFRLPFLIEEISIQTVKFSKSILKT